VNPRAVERLEELDQLKKFTNVIGTRARASTREREREREREKKVGGW
jgi:hypothetical protein